VSLRVLPLIAAVLPLALSACTMNRTLTIDSHPQGAHVWVNGELNKKTTPVDVPFTHYGTFSYRLEMDGYESQAGDIKIKARADGFPVIDLPLEMVSPDRRWRRTFDLVPLTRHPSESHVEAVRKRAEALRDDAHRAANEPGTPGRAAPGRERP